MDTATQDDGEGPRPKVSALLLLEHEGKTEVVHVSESSAVRVPRWIPTLSGLLVCAAWVVAICSFLLWLQSRSDSRVMHANRADKLHMEEQR